MSVNSNLIEEFTLLLCVTPEDQAGGVIGGNTIIHTFGGATKPGGASKTFDTTTPGNGLLFRKDLEHESSYLMKGAKHIITANIWATRTEKSAQVLLVTFPTDESIEEAPAAFDRQSVLLELRPLRVKELKYKLNEHRVDWRTMLEKEEMVNALCNAMEAGHNAASIKNVANASQTFALPVDNLTGMLLTHVQWANRAAEQEGKDEPPVVTYECRDFDFDAFEVVYKILNRSYVSEQAIYDNSDALDYFGPFDRRNIHVNLTLENADATEGATANGPKIKKARTGESNDDPFDEDLIICETEARMRAVAHVATVLGVNSYVPFKILFVEGVLQSRWEDGNAGVIEVPMTAVACLLGDYDHVFCIRNVCNKCGVEPTSLHSIHTESNLFQTFPPLVLNKLLSGVQPGDAVDFFPNDYAPVNVRMEWEQSGHEVGDEDHPRHTLNEYGYGLALMVGLEATDIDLKSAIVSSCVHEPNYMLIWDASSKGQLKTVYLPGLENANGEDADDGASLFHRNEEGKVTFTSKEAERASNFIASYGLEERVKSTLQKKRFVLPQQADQVHANFCNESVYGTMNILWVSGVIRMEAGNPATANSTLNEVFDAWPSDEAFAKIDSDRKRYREQEEPWWDHEITD